MGKDDWGSYDRESKFLGKQIGFKFKFLAYTSCMDKQTRLDLAGIETFRSMIENDKDSKETVDFIDKIVKPLLEKIGYANWERDILTHLALKTALTRKKTLDIRSVLPD